MYLRSKFSCRRDNKCTNRFLSSFIFRGVELRVCTMGRRKQQFFPFRLGYSQVSPFRLELMELIAPVQEWRFQTGLDASKTQSFNPRLLKDIFRQCQEILWNFQKFNCSSKTHIRVVRKVEIFSSLFHYFRNCL